MRKGQLVGPYEGSIPDKVMAFLESGVNDLKQIGMSLGYTPYELRQSLRHLVKRGFVMIDGGRVTVHESH